jgi:hypothetical protein
MDAAVDVVDVQEETFIGTGSLVLEWTVRGMPAATGCAVAGGVSVRFPANFVQFMQDTTVPCEQGTLRLPDTAATLAAVTAELLDASGTIIHRFTVESNVAAGRENRAVIRFEREGRLTIRWTINGEAPGTQCTTVNGYAVNVSVQRSAPMNLRCAARTVTFSNVQVGPVTAVGTLYFNMMDRRPPVTINGTAEITSGATSTVDLDFEAQAVMMAP